MRQRLAIAQAMLGMLDEPPNGLDPPQISAMRDVLRDYASRGRTVLVSSHLLARGTDDKIAVAVRPATPAVADRTRTAITALARSC